MAAIRTRTRMVAARGLTPPSQVVASQEARQARDRQNNVAPAPVPRKLPDKTAPQPYVAPEGPVRFQPKTPGLTNQQSHSTPPPPPPPPPPAPSSSSASSRAFVVVVGARYAQFVHCSHRVSLHRGTNNSATTSRFLF